MQLSRHLRKPRKRNGVGFFHSTQIEAQRSGFDLEKEEGLSGCAVFAALTQPRKRNGAEFF